MVQHVMHGLYIETLFDFGERTENQMRRRDDIQYNFIHDDKMIYKTALAAVIKVESRSDF